jgi:type I restriction enzyme, S subunit
MSSPVKIKTFTSKIGSGATPRGGDSAYKKEGVSLIRSQNILDLRFSESGLAHIDEVQAKKLDNVTVQQNDVLLNITGDSIARVCRVPDKILPARANQHVSIIRCNDSADSAYLMYYLHNLKPYLLRLCKVGGTRNALTKEAVENLPVLFQNNSRQRAAVLSAFDTKIELNNRINAELEAMAKTLYDYWFVQFDFPFDFSQGRPDANGRPYKSSGGKMVYNPTLKRKIPEGWNDRELDEIISRSGTGLNPRENFKLGHGSNFYVTIKNVQNGKIVLDDKCDKIDDEALQIIDRRSQLQPGDTLFTSIQPVGVTYLIQEKPINWNINESVFTIRPNYEQVSAEYLFLLLSSDEMKAFTKHSSAGSVHKGIRHGVLKTFRLPYGNKNLIDQFSEIVRPLLRRVYTLDQETQQLTSLRDFLLPMLMNGQVQVG